MDLSHADTVHSTPLDVHAAPLNHVQTLLIIEIENHNESTVIASLPALAVFLRV